MRCEVISVGTELLLGQIIDSNSSWLGEQLAQVGVDCLWQVKVGDNHDRIVQAITDALRRSDAVIVCGGLGPTQDDITREAVSEVMGVDLVLDEDVASRITMMFESRGRSMPQNNLRQAQVPVGATVIEQRLGTAPGLICPVSSGDLSGVVYLLPGVPYEMKEMTTRSVLPDLMARSADPAVIRSRNIRVWGLSESGMAEMVADIVDSQTNPTVAYLARGIEGLWLRVTAKAPNDGEATRLVDEMLDRLVARLGDSVFSDDERTIEQVVGELLVQRGLTLAIAESMTGGLVAGRCTAAVGSSDWFTGAVVSYATAVKRSLLGVESESVYSSAAALEMARGARQTLGSDVALGISGVAGPDSVQGIDPGTVFVGLSTPYGDHSLEMKLPGDRQRVREYAVISSLDLLRRHLSAIDGSQTSTSWSVQR